MHGLHKCKEFVKFADRGINGRTLRNIALLLHMQRSSRHKNCRMGGLMFDSICLKFNSKQSSIWIQIIMYYITLLAKFEHGMGSWARPMEEQVFQSFLFGGSKKVTCCFTMYFGHDFLSPHTTIASGVETYPSPSVSCCFDDLAQLLPCLDL